MLTDTSRENILSLWTVKPDGVKVWHRVLGLSTKETEGIADHLLSCSVSILCSLNAYTCSVYDRWCKDHYWYKYVAYYSHRYACLKFDPIRVVKISCPYGPSNLTV